MRPLTIVFLVCFGFFLFYSVFGIWLYQTYGLVNNSQDFAFHWNKINGRAIEPYPGLFHFLFDFAKGNQPGLYFGVVILICFIIPFALFIVSKSYWSIIIYFFVVALPHMLLYGATYPEALVLFWLICYLYIRPNIWWFLTFAALSSLTHKQGLALFAIIGFLELIPFLKKNARIVFPVLFLETASAAQPGYLSPVVLNKLQVMPLFLWQLPVFSLFLLKKIDFFYAGLFVSSLLGSLVDFRALSVAQIVLCVVGGKQLLSYKKDYKALLLIFCLFQLSWFFLEYVGGTWKMIAWN